VSQTYGNTTNLGLRYSGEIPQNTTGSESLQEILIDLGLYGGIVIDIADNWGDVTNIEIYKFRIYHTPEIAARNSSLETSMGGELEVLPQYSSNIADRISLIEEGLTIGAEYDAEDVISTDKIVVKRASGDYNIVDFFEALRWKSTQRIRILPTEPSPTTVIMSGENDGVTVDAVDQYNRTVVFSRPAGESLSWHGRVVVDSQYDRTVTVQITGVSFVVGIGMPALPSPIELTAWDTLELFLIPDDAYSTCLVKILRHNPEALPLINDDTAVDLATEVGELVFRDGLDTRSMPWRDVLDYVVRKPTFFPITAWINGTTNIEYLHANDDGTFDYSGGLGGLTYNGPAFTSGTMFGMDAVNFGSGQYIEFGNRLTTVTGVLIVLKYNDPDNNSTKGWYLGDTITDDFAPDDNKVGHETNCPFYDKIHICAELNNVATEVPNTVYAYWGSPFYGVKYIGHDQVSGTNYFDGQIRAMYIFKSGSDEHQLTQIVTWYLSQLR